MGMVNLELYGGDFAEMVSDSVIGVDFEVGVWGDHVPGIWRKSPCFLVFYTPHTLQNSHCCTSLTKMSEKIP